MKNSIKRILCIALCVCTVLTLALGMVSCKREELPQEGPKEGEIAVVRVVSDIKKGEKITSDKVYIDYVKEENVHYNAIRELEKVLDKYLTVDVLAGDYLFAGKLTSGTDNADERGDSAYISVQSYIKDGEDCTDIIQDLIYENSGRTLYFADGVYFISKPLIISANSATKVSFELSDLAVIKAADSWSSEDAMIRIGANDKKADEALANVTLKGGFIDGSGKAKGISVEGGRDAFISGVTVKNTPLGIAFAAGEYDTRTTVENTNIVCVADDSSVGMAVDSNSNVFENVRIDGAHIGVKLTGKNNILKSIFATYNGAATTSIGFEDKSEHNNYDMCFSENFAVGFYMGADTVGSAYVGCYAFWNNGVLEQTAYKAEGRFNSSIRSSRADFNDNDVGISCAYLSVGEEGGSGKVLWPLIKNVGYINVGDHNNYLGTTTVIEIAN